MAVNSKKDMKRSVKTSDNLSGTNRSPILMWILVLVIIQLILSFTIILSGDFGNTAKIGAMDKKVSAIDNFFRTNIKGYDSNTGNSNDVATTGNTAAQVAVNVSGDKDDPYIGNPDAKVTVVEFSDFQCPFCRKYWTDSFSQIKKNYIDTGKVKYVFRDFPLTSIHPASIPAAIAASCAQEQGGNQEYFKMHEKIFSEENKIGIDTTVDFGPSDLRKWAQEIGLNMQEYDKCLIDPAQKTKIEKDVQAATQAGVTGTPTFFVNGKMLVGAQPYSMFKQAIDSALASAK